MEGSHKSSENKLRARKPELVALRERQRNRNRAVAALGVLVVLATALALMVPAITMARGDLICGMEEHQHSDVCYEKVLTCTQEEGENHAHSDACYESQLTCTKAVHTHDDTCYADPEPEPVANQQSSPDAVVTNQQSASGTDTANQQPGVLANDGGTNQQSSDQPGVLAGDGTGANVVTTDQTATPADSASANPEFPAQTFEANLVEKDGDKEKTVLTVSVDAPEGALPPDTTMKVDGVDADKVASDLKAAISYDANLKGKAEPGRAIAVNVTFTDADNNKVEPAEDLKVKIWSSYVPEFSATEAELEGQGPGDADAAAPAPARYGKPVLIHVLDAKKAKEDGKLDSDGKPMKAEILKDAILANWDDEDKAKGREDTFKFEGDESGTYVIAELLAVDSDNVDGQLQAGEGGEIPDDAADANGEPGGADGDGATDANGDAVGADGEAGANANANTEGNTIITTDERPAKHLSDKLVDANGNTTLTVDVDAPDGALPEGVRMQLTPVTKESILDAAKDEAASKTDIDATRAKAVAVDITFFDKDGAMVEPQAEVHVTMAVPAAVQEAGTAGVAKRDNGSAKSSAPDNLAIVHMADNQKAEVVSTTSADPATATAEFDSADFSVYALVYTVDFHWEVNGQAYEFNLPGGGFIGLKELVGILGVVDGDASTFIADVASVTSSNPNLVWIGKIDADTTVGELKATNNLECEYSSELTDMEIAQINAQAIEAGDWALISLKPFDTEESLTITMKTGDVFTIKVTDAHKIPDSSSSTIDVAKSYLICYEANGQYYLLKNDGGVDGTHTPADFENLNSTYCWTFNYVFEEKDLDETLTYVYYLIRPIDNKTKTIALNAEGEPLVQQSNNNVAVVPAEGGGFNLIGYNNVKLNFENDAFFADQLPAGNNGITVHIYEMDVLPTYSYTARSADEGRGSVTIAGGTEKTEGEGDEATHYYEAESDSDKKNAGTITATPANHTDGQGHNKWQFDHWTLDGIALDRDQYPAAINANTLPIPHNGTKLVAHFKQNPQYVVPDSEKQPSSIENLDNWLNELAEKHVPLDENETAKTAEVYDYENRIYRVDIASKANFKTFKGDVDMAFCMDVSNSMYFPSKLIEATLPNHTNPLPIYQINNNGWTWNNRNWLDTSRGWNNPYYLIADQSNTATVFKVYYQDGNWKAQDASRETETEKSFVIGQSFETNWTSDETDKTHPFNAGDNNDTTYTIYDAGDEGRNRFYYLNQAFSGATLDLLTIKNILAVAGDESPDVNIAFNTFNKELGKQWQNFEQVQHIQEIDLSNSHGGGTRPDQAFNDAQNFNWQGNDRYVILITDGAPQGLRDNESLTPSQIVDAARIAAEELKKGQDRIEGTADDVKVITVGLSLDKVPSGKKLLYDIADNDKDGNKMFFMAESASDLPNILRQITKTIMDDAIVIGDVTDTVGEAFYAVDKNTGLPLKAGDKIDIEGCLTTDPNQVAGIVQPDGVTIKWSDQAIDSTIGWHGTVFVKAKEDLLGGNAVKTNGDAEITATKYRMDDRVYNFDESQLGDKLKSLEISLNSPRVNVNELSFPSESTEWTVYLGTKVDPKEQLKQMYEDILVSEVVNKDNSLHYPISPNNIADNREGEASGTAKTFALAPMILDLIKEDQILAGKYVQNEELNWDVFLTDIQKPDGVVVPYHTYGIEGEDSNIVIKLTQENRDGTEYNLVNQSPHDTTVVNNGDTPAEKYVLSVQYNPDYDHVLPVGQGGGGHLPYGTGTYGAMYQGHAAGRETSTNTHVINVYNVPIDVYKTDENNRALQGATFRLYKAASEGDGGVAVEGLDGTYVLAASGVSGFDGIAHLKDGNGNAFGLVQGETYYLIEAEAPNGYNKVSTVWAVQVQTEVGAFTDLDGNPIYSTATPPPAVGNGVTSDMYPFNWDQGARVMLDGKQPVTVIARGEGASSSQPITDGSFVSHKDAISFQHTVQNIGGTIDINVNKTWENEDHKPASVEVTLYRVSEKDHLWGEGKVVPSTCTAEGVKEYTCSACGETKTYTISAAGHKPGAIRHENEVTPTCTTAGGYDEVERCTVCNAIISSEHVDIPAAHTWGEPQEEAASETGYCYDTVVRCTVCGTEKEGSREHHAHAWGEPQEVATTGDPTTCCYDTIVKCSKCGFVKEDSRQHHEHAWGEWVATTPARINVYGEETRTCSHNSTHVETRPINPLPATVTIYFRCTGNGNGGTSYPGQITSIATRSGSGYGDMTIQWNWNQWTNPQNVTILVDNLGTSTYSTTSSGNYDGAQQTLVIRNITTDLIVYVTFRNSNYTGTNSDLIGNPTFAGLPSRSLQSAGQTLMRSLITMGQSAARASAMTLAEQTIGAVRAGEGEQGAASDSQPSMAHEDLTSYIESLPEKNGASCVTDAENHEYVEVVGTYTIEPDNDSWSKSIPGLPKHNEYGKEYRYYVVEKNPVDGYSITYTGQESGLHGDATEATINNEKLFGSLNVTKTVRAAGGPAEQGAFPSGTYTYPILVTTVIGETTYYVQDVNGTLATTPPATRLTVTSGALNETGTPLTINNLPYGTYTVTEIQPESVDVTGFSFVISTDGPQAVHSITSGEGEVGKVPGSVALENYYMRGARWQPEVSKWLNGSPHSGSEEGYAGYSFTLTEPEGQNTIHHRPHPGQEPSQQNDHVLTATTNENGVAVFDEIGYGPHLIEGNTSRNFTYTITEDRPADAQNEPYISDNIQYDTKTIYVVVTVTKNGGTMEAHAKYYSDEAHTQSIDAVEFNNTELASLSVTKTVAGSYTPTADESFPIAIKRGELFLNLEGQLVDTDPQLTIRADQTLTFEHIPVGTYVVTEGNAERPGYSLSTTYTSQVGSGEPSATHSVTLSKGDSGSVGINNEYYQVDIKIVKIDEATRDDATPTTLPNAKFKLYKYVIPEEDGEGAYTPFPNASTYEHTTGSDGSLVFQGLTDGNYQIEESQQPDGYVTETTLKIYFKIEHGVVTWTDENGTTIDTQNLVSYSSANKTFTVGNVSGAELPHTGGPGTGAVTLIGCLLVAAGAFLLLRKRGNYDGFRRWQRG